MLRWARAQAPPVPWSGATPAAAAKLGNIPLLECLYAQNPPCPMGSLAVDAAAERGRLNVFKWLRARLPAHCFLLLALTEEILMCFCEDLIA